MRSRSHDLQPLTDTEPGQPRSRRALLVVAAILFVALMGVEFLTLRMWVLSSDTASDLASQMSELTNLAKLERDVLLLTREVHALHGDDPPTADDIALRRDLAESQFRRLEPRWEGGPERMADLDRALDRLDRWIADSEADGFDPSEVAAAAPLLDDLDEEAMGLYTRSERPYQAASSRALRERSQWNGLLLGSTAALGLFSIAAVIVARRSAQADHDAAYATIVASEARHRKVMDSVEDVIFTTDEEGRWTYLSAAWTRLTGRSVEESLGQRFCELVHPEDRERHVGRLAGVLTDQGDARDEVRYVRDDGGVVWVSVWMSSNEHGETFGTIVDVTERRSFEAELHHQAQHDSLTGLASRDLIGETIEESMRRAGQTDSLTAVLFIDLDRFKLVNDSLGHDVGDLVLTEVAARLESAVENASGVARLGGDEFVVVVDGLHADPLEAVTQAQAAADQLQSAISEPFDVGPDRASLTASIGITIASGVDRADSVIAEADAAMYRAKELGKSRHEVFDACLKQQASNRLHLEHALRGAIDAGEFELHHQPILDARTLDVVGTEALLRWNHPTQGLISPDAFLAVAEEAGLMTEIGMWVLRTACASVVQWRARPGVSPELKVSVNLSARELGSPGLASTIGDVLHEIGLPPEALCVEVTEHHLIGQSEMAVDNLFAMSAQGVCVAMDDFGTGYSSLSYLRRLPIDVIKIDRSFVSPLASSTPDVDDRALISAIVDLARSLRLSTVAEGVETQAQLELLRSLGVDMVQGNLTGGPKPTGELSHEVSQFATPFG